MWKQHVLWKALTHRIVKNLQEFKKQEFKKHLILFFNCKMDLGTSSCYRTRYIFSQWSQTIYLVRGAGSTGRQQSRGKSLLQLLGTHMKTMLHLCYICVCGGGYGVDLSPALVCYLVGSSISGSCRRVQISWLWWSYGIPIPSRFLNPFANSYTRLPKVILCLSVGLCIGYSHLLGRSFQRTIMIGSYLQV